jgi:hypothetical protein
MDTSSYRSDCTATLGLPKIERSIFRTLRAAAEDDSEKPVTMHSTALESLRTSKNDDDLIQMCAEDEGTPVAKIPASCVVASEILLSHSPSSGLIVRGEHQFLEEHTLRAVLGLVRWIPIEREGSPPDHESR